MLLQPCLLWLVLLALFIGYRAATSGQSDNAAKLSSKRDYLAQMDAYRRWQEGVEGADE